MAAIVLAGCMHTGNDTQENEDVQIRGLLVDQFSVEDTQLEEGEGTRIILKMRNMNPTPIRMQGVSFSNTGLLSEGGEIQVVDSDVGSDCSGEIRGLEEGIPAERQCIFEIPEVQSDALLNLDGEQTVPLTAAIEYDAILDSHQDLVRVDFVEDPSRTRTTQQANNGELRLDVSYPAQFRSDAQEGDSFKFDVAVSNVGSGRVTDRDVNILCNLEGSFFSYEGTRIFDFITEEQDRIDDIDQSTRLFAGHGGIDGYSEICRQVTLSRDAANAQFELQVEMSNNADLISDGTRVSTNMMAEYTYRLEHQLPITVSER